MYAYSIHACDGVVNNIIAKGVWWKEHYVLSDNSSVNFLLHYNDTHTLTQHAQRHFIKPVSKYGRTSEGKFYGQFYSTCFVQETALVACIFHSEYCYTEKQGVNVLLEKKLYYLSKHMIGDVEANRKMGDLVLQDLLLQDMVVLNRKMSIR